jgi:putative ABC transport system permease protein
MFLYFVRLAWASVQRSRYMSLLMALTIGFGVAATMTTVSLYVSIAADPAPTRSGKLYVPQIDAWGPTANKGSEEPPGGLTYVDAMALQKAHKAKYQSAIFAIQPTITIPNGDAKPFHAKGYAVSSEFFPMADVPFLSGTAWAGSEEDDMPTVAVISHKLALRLFGAKSAIGGIFNINNQPIRIIGVTSDWNPQPRFFDVFGSGGFSADSIDIFLPVTTAGGLALNPVGNMDCTPVARSPSDSCVWMSFLVYLDTPDEVKAYKAYLDAYSRDMQDKGRFAWPPNSRLRSLPEWLDHMHVIPSDTRVSIVVAFGLLAVCLASVLGLLVVVFDRRSQEVGVRRALGATRMAIASQFFVEAGVIGALGGISASILTLGGITLLRNALPVAIGGMLRLSASMLAVTILVAVLVTVLAATYPSLKFANPRLGSLLKDS